MNRCQRPDRGRAHDRRRPLRSSSSRRATRRRTRQPAFPAGLRRDQLTRGRAPRRVSSHDPDASLEALARAYRSWALAQPHRYQLLFAPPLPGYDAHAQRLIDAAQKAMNLLLDTLAETGDRAAAAPPPQPLASQLAAWTQPHHPGIDPAIALRAVLIWSRLHGLVSLEIAENFAS